MPTLDAFAIFDLPRRFAIDRDELRRRMLAESAKHHPDRYPDPIEQADAADRLAEINLAYQTLNDDRQRSNLLLDLLGGPGKEPDKSLPPDWLMQIMEVRQELEQAIAANDGHTLHRLKNWADQQKAECWQQITQALDAAGQEPMEHRRPLLKQARMHLNVLAYLQRMHDEFPDSSK